MVKTYEITFSGEGDPLMEEAPGGVGQWVDIEDYEALERRCELLSLAVSAESFATAAHAGQKRHRGEPYINHCRRVAESVARAGGSFAMVEAAWLHDVVEDTDYTIEEIEEVFGSRVAGLVWELTNVFTSEAYPDLNRAARKRLEAVRLAEISDEARLIKRCDIVDNMSMIVDRPEFASIYVAEKLDILEKWR